MSKRKNTKTDNANLGSKLMLRSYFLNKYHAGERIDVLDCCEGGGTIWSRLRKEFSVTQYWGLDLKNKRGRLKVNSARVLSMPGWTQNVIDIDTYASPWGHWLAMLPNVERPVTVFLTCGQVTVGGSPMTREESDSLGVGGMSYIPNSIQAKLKEFSARYCLTRACDFGITIKEAKKITENHVVSYMGLRLEPG